MKKSTAIFFLLGLSLGQSVLAHQQSSTATVKAVGPDASMEKLSALAGNWEVEITVAAEPGKGERPRAICEAYWILDGHVLRQEYTSTFMGRPLSVVQYLGYDPDTKQFFELHMNSMHPAAFHNMGQLSRDGRSLTFVGSRIDPNTHRMGKMRTVWTFLDHDNYKLEWFYLGKRGREQRAVTLVFRRSKEPRG